tara:strand:- start:8738 stop:8962 length:225 start_codon:yes stop_codon:yes gene_type:complete
MTTKPKNTGLCSEEKFKALSNQWTARLRNPDDTFGKCDYTKGLAEGLRIAYADAADRAAYNEKIELERIMLNAL